MLKEEQHDGWSLIIASNLDLSGLSADGSGSVYSPIIDTNPDAPIKPPSLEPGESIGCDLFKIRSEERFSFKYMSRLVGTSELSVRRAAEAGRWGRNYLLVLVDHLVNPRLPDGSVGRHPVVKITRHGKLLHTNTVTVSLREGHGEIDRMATLLDYGPHMIEYRENHEIVRVPEDFAKFLCKLKNYKSAD